jgi:hypothetical protein
MSEIGTVRWFGDSWGAPVCEPRTHIETPVGDDCAGCERAIQAEDIGITMPSVSVADALGRATFHLDCFMREVVGDFG